VNETIKVYHVILLLFVQNCGNFKESRFGCQVEAMQEFFRNLVVSLHLSSSLFSFPSPPHQTIISISSFHTQTMSSFDYLISKEHERISDYKTFNRLFYRLRFLPNRFKNGMSFKWLCKTDWLKQRMCQKKTQVRQQLIPIANCVVTVNVFVFK